MHQISETTQAASYTLSCVYTLADFQKRHQDKFSLNQLKWLIRHRDKNGLSESGAVILSARKFYIAEPLFEAWFINQQKA